MQTANDVVSALLAIGLTIPVIVGIASRLQKRGEPTNASVKAAAIVFGSSGLLCLPLLILALVAGVNWVQAAIAYAIAATAVAMVAVTLFQVKESLDGDPHLRYPLFWLLTDVLSIIGLCAAVYAYVGISQSATGQATHQWYDALYLSVMTFTTVGFGDLAPIGAARIVAIVEALLGNVLLGTWVAVLFSLMRPTAPRRNPPSAV